MESHQCSGISDSPSGRSKGVGVGGGGGVVGALMGLQPTPPAILVDVIVIPIYSSKTFMRLGVD